MADEYISKQAFNDAIREAVRMCPTTFYNGLEVARQIAHNMDAADVRPVVRGRWIGETVWSDRGINVHAMRECNNCHKVRVVDNFCPNCGADMREVDDD